MGYVDEEDDDGPTGKLPAPWLHKTKVTGPVAIPLLSDIIIIPCRL